MVEEKTRGTQNIQHKQTLLPFDRGTWIIVIGSLLSTVIAGLLVAIHGNAVLIFIISGVALSFLAALVGDATEQLGERLGSGATGVLQSALGNLPELFVGIFALRAGLLDVVQAALVGSILGNSLFVLGLAFFVGGIRHGTQRFSSQAPRAIATLSLLAISALAVPTLVHGLHTPAAGHEDGFSIACAIILLIVFVASIPNSLQKTEQDNLTRHSEPLPVQQHEVETTNTSQETFIAPTTPHPVAWPLWLTIIILVLAGVGAAFVSDWFTAALTPAITYLHISAAFTGLVIVALAGNAVENVVGIQFAARNQPDFAISVILNSSLQVALGLTPVLVLLSFVIGSTHLTLVFTPLLVAALFLTTLLSTVITYDGESTWLEGLALMGLYGIIAVSFWWG